jgi:hypothetical protein
MDRFFQVEVGSMTDFFNGLNFHSSLACPKKVSTTASADNRPTSKRHKAKKRKLVDIDETFLSRRFSTKAALATIRDDLESRSISPTTRGPMLEVFNTLQVSVS